MFGDIGNPVEIKISLGMLGDQGVRDALATLLAAMGKAQEAINERLDREFRERPERLGSPFGPPKRH